MWLSTSLVLTRRPSKQRDDACCVWPCGSQNLARRFMTVANFRDTDPHCSVNAHSVQVTRSSREAARTEAGTESQVSNMPRSRRGRPGAAARGTPSHTPHYLQSQIYWRLELEAIVAPRAARSYSLRRPGRVEVDGGMAPWLLTPSSKRPGLLAVPDVRRQGRLGELTSLTH